MSAGAQWPPEQASPPGGDPRWEAVQRIIQSEAFRKTPKLREFLQFICREALEGRTESLHERVIGNAVFGRDLGFDSSHDNVVRRSARQLRHKLDEYYKSEGALEVWRIGIPKGTYVPDFALNDASERPLPAEVRSSPASAYQWALLGMACAAILLAAWLAFFAREGQQRTAAVHTVLWGRVFGDGLPTRVVLPDTNYEVIQESMGRGIPLTEYTDAKYPRKLPDINLNVVEYMVNYQTSATAASVAVSIARLAGPSSNLTVHHSFRLDPSVLENCHVILIGGIRSNPWAELFAAKRAFLLERSGPRRFLNVHPEPGEPPSYHHSRTNSFGAIALLKNPHGAGNVLLLDGPTPPVILAASRFLLEPAMFRRLTAKLPRGSDLTYFDAIFRTQVIQTGTGDIEVIAVRALSGS